MRVLYLSQYFLPESFRGNELARDLRQFGHEVEVLTGQPSYPNRNAFSDYSWWKTSSKVENGLLIHRVPLVPRMGGSICGIALNYLSFVLNAIVFGFFRVRKCKADLVFCYAPSPVIQAIPGIVWCRLTGAKFVLYVQDLWPQSIAESGYVKPGLLTNTLSHLVEHIYEHCDLILVPSRAFVPEIQQIVPSALVRYLPNSVDDRIFHQSRGSRCSRRLPTSTFTCVFAGNIGFSQDFETILGAAQLLKTQPKIQILIYGDGNALSWLKGEILGLGLRNIKCMGRYPIEEMPFVMSNADCLIMSLKDSVVFRKTIPNKLQAYMAMGKPVIASVSGEAARIVIEAGCGLVNRPGDKSGMAESIVKLQRMTDLQRYKYVSAGKSYFAANFEHAMLMKKLNGYLEEVIACA